MNGIYFLHSKNEDLDTSWQNSEFYFHLRVHSIEVYLPNVTVQLYVLV